MCFPSIAEKREVDSEAASGCFTTFNSRQISVEKRKIDREITMANVGTFSHRCGHLFTCIRGLVVLYFDSHHFVFAFCGKGAGIHVGQEPPLPPVPPPQVTQASISVLFFFLLFPQALQTLAPLRNALLVNVVFPIFSSVVVPLIILMPRNTLALLRNAAIWLVSVIVGTVLLCVFNGCSFDTLLSLLPAHEDSTDVVDGFYHFGTFFLSTVRVMLAAVNGYARSTRQHATVATTMATRVLRRQWKLIIFVGCIALLMVQQQATISSLTASNELKERKISNLTASNSDLTASNELKELEISDLTATIESVGGSALDECENKSMFKKMKKIFKSLKKVKSLKR